MRFMAGALKPAQLKNVLTKSRFSFFVLLFQVEKLEVEQCPICLRHLTKGQNYDKHIQVWIYVYKNFLRKCWLIVFKFYVCFTASVQNFVRYICNPQSNTNTNVMSCRSVLKLRTLEPTGIIAVTTKTVTRPNLRNRCLTTWFIS